MQRLAACGLRFGLPSEEHSRVPRPVGSVSVIAPRWVRRVKIVVTQNCCLESLSMSQLYFSVTQDASSSHCICCLFCFYLKTSIFLFLTMASGFLSWCFTSRCSMLWFSGPGIWGLPCFPTQAHGLGPPPGFPQVSPRYQFVRVVFPRNMLGLDYRGILVKTS